MALSWLGYFVSIIWTIAAVFHQDGSLLMVEKTLASLRQLMVGCCLCSLKVKLFQLREARSLRHLFTWFCFDHIIIDQRIREGKSKKTMVLSIA
jgi:hypothetical protein